MDPLRDVAELNRSCTERTASETQLCATGTDAKKKSGMSFSTLEHEDLDIDFGLVY